MFNTPKVHQAAPVKLNIYNLSLSKMEIMGQPPKREAFSSERRVKTAEREGSKDEGIICWMRR
jgi:hypothetical protein